MNRYEAKRYRSEKHSNISNITNKKNDSERTIEHQIFYVETHREKTTGKGSTFISYYHINTSSLSSTPFASSPHLLLDLLLLVQFM